MSENINTNAVLTEKEIFDQIVLLQKQLTEQSPTSLHRLGEALYDARGEGEEAQLSDASVANVCAVFSQREETLNQMLSMYRGMYADIQKEKARAGEAEQKVSAKEIFSHITSLQEQLLSIEETVKSLYAIDDTDEYEDGELVRSVTAEISFAKIDAIKYAFVEREKTLNSLLSFYKDALLESSGYKSAGYGE